MSAWVGSYSLMVAVLIACGAILSCVMAARFGTVRALKAARWCIGALAVCVTMSCVALMTALVQSDFRLSYVAGYTERALPTPYKMAAFWAGQEGSLLLWAWLISILSFIEIVRRRGNGGVREEAATTGVLAVVCGFFAALMLFAANPFAVFPQAPTDGHGLNPLLQDPGMIVHPPLLFIGYAACTVPFAAMVGALVAGRTDSRWLARMRIWVIVSWLFLTAGIVWGAQWAYIELGWGGYWAWDPVENASLLPWLTVTALVHSMMVQQQRGMFKAWNAALLATTFLLCIFGTYLTRSGVIQSVHSFGESLIGTFFLAFLAVGVVGSLAVILVRHKALRPDHRLERLISKEGAVLATNVLLVLIMMVTLVGTIFPLISGFFLDEPISVGPPFYNKVVVPLALVLIGIMTVGPLLSYGPHAAQKLLRGLIVPGSLAGVAVVACWLAGLVDAWALLCVAIAALALGVILWDLAEAARAWAGHHGGSAAAAVLHVIDSNHRRYGAQTAHVGMILLMIGVAGSSLFGAKHNLRLEPGQHVEVGRYGLTFHGLEEVNEVNYRAVQANVTVTRPDGISEQMNPQMRFYNKSEQNNSEVALWWSAREDVYATLAGWETGGKVVALQIMINPLVVWIWIGGVVLFAGGLFGFVPRLLPHAHVTRASIPLAPATQPLVQE